MDSPSGIIIVKRLSEDLLTEDQKSNYSLISSALETKTVVSMTSTTPSILWLWQIESTGPQPKQASYKQKTLNSPPSRDFSFSFRLRTCINAVSSFQHRPINSIVVQPFGSCTGLACTVHIYTIPSCLTIIQLRCQKHGWLLDKLLKIKIFNST